MRKNAFTNRPIFMMVIIYAILCTAISYGASTQDKMQWEKIKSLISQERQTIGQATNRGPDLEHRLFELGSEELNIIKQEENEKFIAEGGKEVQRENYFHQSRQMEKDLFQQGMTVIERFPSYQRIGEIFSTLANNNMEFGDARMTEGLFKKALDKSAPQSTQEYAIRVSLAEYYFNEKKYLPAIDQYAIVTQNYTDKWRSKHLYNMAWCYLKAMDYARGLESLKEALVQSKKSTMVDNSVQILESVPLFFVLEKKVPDAITTIEKYSTRPIPLLLRLATTAGEKMGETEALLVLKQARALASKTPEREDNFLVLEWELDFHQLQKRAGDFLKGLQTFVAFHKKLPLNKELQESIVNKSKLFVGDLQETLAKDMREDVSVYNQERLTVIVDIFESLVTLANKEEGDWRFYQGESLFAVRQFDKAFRAYAMGMKAALEKRVTPDIAPKIFSSAFSAIEEKSFPEAQREPSLRLSYEAYLQIWPTGDQSSSIYQKLMALYLHQKQVGDVERVLASYHTHYPNDVDTQRKDLLTLLDIYIERKEPVIISSWLENMKQGQFAVAADKIKEIETVLGQILFGQYEKLANRDEAIKGLKDLFASEIYPDSIKEKSSYNLAVDYLNRGDAKESLAWIMKSLPFTPSAPFQQKTPSYLGMVLTLSDWGEFATALELSSELFKRAGEFQKQEDKDTLYKLHAMAIFQKRDFERYPELLNLAKANSIDQKIVYPIIRQLANAWAIDEDDWMKQKDLLAVLHDEDVQLFAERKLIQYWVSEQKIHTQALGLASSKIQKAMENLVATKKAIDSTALEFI